MSDRIVKVHGYRPGQVREVDIEEALKKHYIDSYQACAIAREGLGKGEPNVGAFMDSDFKAACQYAEETSKGWRFTKSEVVLLAHNPRLVKERVAAVDRAERIRQAMKKRVG